MRIRSENFAAYLRQQKGMATKIAATLEVSKACVSQWASGKTPIPDNYTPIICEMLGRSVEDLCLTISRFTVQLPDDEETRLMLKVWENLPQSGRDRVLATALREKSNEQDQHHE